MVAFEYAFSFMSTDGALFQSWFMYTSTEQVLVSIFRQIKILMQQNLGCDCDPICISWDISMYGFLLQPIVYWTVCELVE